MEWEQPLQAASVVGPAEVRELVRTRHSELAALQASVVDHRPAEVGLVDFVETAELAESEAPAGLAVAVGSAAARSGPSYISPVSFVPLWKA